MRNTYVYLFLTKIYIILYWYIIIIIQADTRDSKSLDRSGLLCKKKNCIRRGRETNVYNARRVAQYAIAAEVQLLPSLSRLGCPTTVARTTRVRNVEEVTFGQLKNTNVRIILHTHTHTNIQWIL